MFSQNGFSAALAVLKFTVDEDREGCVVPGSQAAWESTNVAMWG